MRPACSATSPSPLRAERGFKGVSLIFALPVLLASGIAAAQPSPSIPGQVAVLRGLDKTTARISTFEAPVDRSVRFGTLVITVRACLKRPPEEPPESAAFLQIEEIRPQEPAPGSGGTAPQIVSRRIFSGWMFASSPALSALENPVYDIVVLDCKTATTSSPSSGSTRK